MKGSWPEAKKNSAKAAATAKAEDVNQNHYVKDYGMTIQQQYQQTKVLAGPLNGGDITMTSLEISELVDKRHDNVKRTIETLVERGVIQLPQIEDCGRINGLGLKQSLSVYVFTGKQGKRDSLIVVAQLCPEFTARIVDRWQELEEAVSTPAANLPDFSNPAAAARAWAEQYELGQVLAIENKQQQEQIHSLESLFRQGMTIPQFCKMLNGVNSQQVCIFFEARGWLYNESRSGKRWRAASYARDRYLTEEQKEIRSHGFESFINFTPVLLQKGAVRVYQIYLKGELPMKKDWDGLFTQDKVIKGAA
ncbi:Rha family transcriptional regulator [Aeromonas veronii]|uniref:Rha family transcriptional regulator n=1 Tax=Aeromonas veronii TaxID=654 RepID=UPI001F224611|nr:Rha family transcriptional regulator [Aeromonas veronii]MCF5912038.1 Rha family transcriptional regulator [Aeromonas veronii]MCO5341154.1 Rha family transcriptional regulator [Aeromonas veronii]